MDPKDIRNLVESYQNVYAEQEVSEDMYSTVKAGLEKGSKALENSPAGGVLKVLVGPAGGNKGKRTPSAADQKKKIAANESVSEPKRTVKMSATGREPIGDKVIRTIGDKLKKTFGGKGTDKSANESVELYNIVFNHLVEEGFASSEENAEKIISVMSDEWISSIVENRGMAYSGGKPGASGDGSKPKGIEGGKTYQMPGFDDDSTKKPKLKGV
jgi:hypothetical protein